MPESDERSVRRLAVLPFKPLVPEVRNEAMESGIADILIARLAELQALTVSPLSAVRRYADVTQNPIAAGRELRVDAVLDGHIYRAGDRIRVSVRLVRVADEKQYGQTSMMSRLLACSRSRMRSHSRSRAPWRLN